MLFLKNLLLLLAFRFRDGSCSEYKLLFLYAFLWPKVSAPRNNPANAARHHHGYIMPDGCIAP